MGDAYGRNGEPMTDKTERIWLEAEKALSAAVDQIEKIAGVISIHAQYAQPVAVMVILVADDEAKQAVSALECQLSHGSDHSPLDIHVQRVARDEVNLEQAALSTAFSLLWSTN